MSEESNPLGIIPRGIRWTGVVAFHDGMLNIAGDRKPLVDAGVEEGTIVIVKDGERATYQSTVRFRVNTAYVRIPQYLHSLYQRGDAVTVWIIPLPVKAYKRGSRVVNP